MMMKLLFSVRSTYGRERYYPVNIPAKAICGIANYKSLLIHQVKTLKDAGFEIVDVSPSINDRINEAASDGT